MMMMCPESRICAWMVVTIYSNDTEYLFCVYTHLLFKNLHIMISQF